ncbi:MAG: hypothetical protein IJL32_05055 [Oscillospiraceae bacterium]|nr:hypothetical protein [Oscillospiraceae bacterium]
MTELEIMQRAKQYIDALANGFDPLSGKPVPEGDTVNQVRISRCLFYVSGVLQKVIDNGGEVQKKKTPRSKKAPLSLTAEQLAQLKPHTSRLSASKVTAAVNSLIDTEKMQRLKVTVLVRWLVSAGMLTEIETDAGHMRRVPTPEGERLGIRETSFVNEQGNTAYYVIYDRNAQQFIFDNLDAIIAFASGDADEA